MYVSDARSSLFWMSKTKLLCWWGFADLHTYIHTYVHTYIHTCRTPLIDTCTLWHFGMPARKWKVRLRRTGVALGVARIPMIAPCSTVMRPQKLCRRLSHECLSLLEIPEVRQYKLHPPHKKLTWNPKIDGFVDVFPLAFFKIQPFIFGV